MGDGERAGFFGVVDEVALGAMISFFADDFDGVLIGADSAVGTKAIKERADRVGILG